MTYKAKNIHMQVQLCVQWRVMWPLIFSKLITLTDFFCKGIFFFAFSFCFCFGFGGSQGGTEISTHGAEQKTHVWKQKPRSKGNMSSQAPWEFLMTTSALGPGAQAHLNEIPRGQGGPYLLPTYKLLFSTSYPSNTSNTSFYFAPVPLLFPHYTIGEEIKAKRGRVTCWRWHSNEGEVELELGLTLTLCPEPHFYMTYINEFKHEWFSSPPAQHPDTQRHKQFLPLLNPPQQLVCRIWKKPQLL